MQQLATLVEIEKYKFIALKMARYMLECSLYTLWQKHRGFIYIYDLLDTTSIGLLYI